HARRNQCDLLIAAAPSSKALANPQLQALIVPFADIPSPTRKKLRKTRPLPVYTIHFNSEAVAEMAIALWLTGAKQLLQADRNLRLGKWSREPAGRIRNSNVLVLGYGRIGREVCRMAAALGSRVTAISRTITDLVNDSAELQPLAA